MLRITAIHDGKVLRIKVEGRLAGMWVEELRTTILQNKPCSALELDIGDVTFIDEDGEQLLLWIDRMGGHFRGGGAFSDFVCKRLEIPISA